MGKRRKVREPLIGWRDEEGWHESCADGRRLRFGVRILAFTDGLYRRCVGSHLVHYHHLCWLVPALVFLSFPFAFHSLSFPFLSFLFPFSSLVEVNGRDSTQRAPFTDTPPPPYTYRRSWCKEQSVPPISISGRIGSNGAGWLIVTKNTLLSPT